MKNKLKNPIQLLTLAALLACPITSNAAVVKDINTTMTALLGHDAQVTNVYEAERQGLNVAAPKAQPWSSSYWPDILGGIANHYRDRGFMGNLLFFILKYDAAKSRFQNDAKDTASNFGGWDADKLNQKLSPTEKIRSSFRRHEFYFHEKRNGRY